MDRHHRASARRRRRRAIRAARRASRKRRSLMLCLVAHVDGRKLWYPLPNHRARLGRADENEIRLPSERGVSKHHAVLEKTADGRYLLTNDARSKNGVIVGEETVAHVFLEQIGRAHV